jgi:hypothetical protein
MYRVAIAVVAVFLLAIGVTANCFLLTMEPADADVEKPLTPPPDPVAIHDGEEITWRGVVCDAWQGGCRLRQMMTGADGKTRAIAPAIFFANENDWEKALHAWGHELEVRGSVKGGMIKEAQLIGNQSGNSSTTSEPEPPPLVSSRR